MDVILSSRTPGGESVEIARETRYLGVVVARSVRPYRCALTSRGFPSLELLFLRRPTLRRSLWKDHHEAPVSAKRSQASQEARLPLPDEHSRRSCRPAFSPPEGPRPHLGVIERLSSGRAFDRLHAEGVRSGRGPVRLVKRSDPASPPRFAFAIPRSVGNAVVRNRIRRRIRAILADLAGSDPPRLEGGDHLIRVTASIDHWSHHTLRTVMAELLAPVTASDEIQVTASGEAE